MNIKLMIIVFLTLFPAVYSQSVGSSSVDELIRYEVHPSNTFLYLYQYSPGTVQNDNENLVQERTATFYTPYSNWLTGDLDGDGIDELIRYDPNTVEGLSGGMIGSRYVTRFYTYQYAPNTISEMGSNKNLVKEDIAIFYKPDSNWIVGDLDGDGIDELIRYEVHPSNTFLYIYQYSPGTVQNDNENLVLEGTATFYTPYSDWLTGDLDGDGIDELIRYEVHPSNTFLYIYQYSPGTVQNDNENLVQEGTATFYTPYSDWLTGDLDGDGIDELVRYDPNTVEDLGGGMIGSRYVTRFYTYQYAPNTISEIGGNKNLVKEDIAIFYRPESNWIVGDLDRAINIDSYTPSKDKITINEGENVNFEITASNNDNIQLGYSWRIDGVESGTEPKWRYVSDYKSEGIHKITCYISDGKGNVSRGWEVRVKNVNRKPEVSITSPVAGDILAGVSSIRWSASDPDGDELKVTIVISPDDGQTWDLIADGEANDGEYGFDTSNLSGQYKIKVIVKDKEGAPGEAVSGSFTIDNGPLESVPPPETPGLYQPKMDFQGGYISINSNPPGAMILIDGKYFGETSEYDKNVEISPGTHIVRLLKDKYLPWDRSITVKEGETVEINALLIPMVFGMSLIKFLGIVLIILLLITAAAVVLNQKKELKKQPDSGGPPADEDLGEK